MALARWTSRKSFDEAVAKAAKLKNAAQAKERRNSLLFTDAQERLRSELRLQPRQEVVAPLVPGCSYCQNRLVRIKPSRSMTRVRVTRR